MVLPSESMVLLTTEYGMEVFDLGEYQIPAEVLSLLPAALARQYNVVPIMTLSHGGSDSVLSIAMAHPRHLDTMDALRRELGMDIDAVICHPDDITAALDQHYPI